MKGAYVWECYWCGRDIHNAYKVAWLEDNPKKRWEVFHWSPCLDQYKAEMKVTVVSRGMPAFRLYVPYMGDTVILGE